MRFRISGKTEIPKTQISNISRIRIFRNRQKTKNTHFLEFVISHFWKNWSSDKQEIQLYTNAPFPEHRKNWIHPFPRILHFMKFNISVLLGSLTRIQKCRTCKYPGVYDSKDMGGGRGKLAIVGSVEFQCWPAVRWHTRWFRVFDDLTIFVFVIMFVCFIVLFLSPRIE